MEDHKNEEKQNLKNIIDILLNKLNELINMSYPEEIKKFLPISSITIMKDIIEFEKINIETNKNDIILDIKNMLANIKDKLNNLLINLKERKEKEIQNFYNEITNLINVIDKKPSTNKNNIIEKSIPTNKINIIDKNQTVEKKNMKYNNGDEYFGECIDNLRNGNGIMYYNSNSPKLKYDGEWKNDLMDGKGTLYFRNGNKYEGEFRNNTIEGKGKFIYTEDVYEGDYKDCEKEGKGAYFFNDGDVYEGDWKNSAKD